MKTYTLDIDGVPHLVFRAKNDEKAKLWESADTSPHVFAPPDIGTWTVRPATIPEQAAWRAMTVKVDLKIEKHGLDWPSEDNTYNPDEAVLRL